MDDKGLLGHGILHNRKYLKIRHVSNSRDMNKEKQQPLVQ